MPNLIDETELIKAREEIAQLRASNAALIREGMKRWQESPAFDTFCELKHGPSGRVLSALQDGEISRGRAAECLAEIAHGATEVNLPECTWSFGDNEIPAEVLVELRKDKERIDKLDKYVNTGAANGLKTLLTGNGDIRAVIDAAMESK